MSELVGATVLVRADASLAIGTGHVTRCITLAQALAARGARCRFVGRAFEGHLLDRVRALGFEALALPASNGAILVPAGPHGAWLGAAIDDDVRQTLAALAGARADWLVVDHYALDARWERALQPACRRLLAIDDLADRPHAAQLLLDQNLGRSAIDYAAWVEPDCRVLAGPAYALLRPQFAALREASLTRRLARPPLRRLLVALGGVDADNHTGAVLSALRDSGLPNDARLSVVMGTAAPALEALRAQAACLPWPTELRVGVQDMAGLMLESDLAIAAVGMSAWERCCMGLPSILRVLAENQRPGAVALDRAGAGLLLDEAAPLAQALRAALKTLLPSEARAAMTEAAAAVGDGRGTERVVAAMEALHD